MSKTPSEYLDFLKLNIALSEIVSHCKIIKEYTTAVDGYLRVRLKLSNGDILEASEYFEQVLGKIKTVDYRYQWMSSTKRLCCRWDSTPHHPELSNFPHHMHQDNEENVAPSTILSIPQVLEVIKKQLMEQHKDKRI